MEPAIAPRLGRYEIDREIGRGGMSVVYKARDPALGRSVALKVLHPHLASRAESRERFEREAQAVARLHHPNILEVFDYAPPDSERAYIVSEFIDGPTLRAFVDEHPIRRAEVAALMMVPIFDALEHAHLAGIVHRDVKPENVMVSPAGVPILMDFGIAQLVDMETLTQTGTILGSPAHMAPEVVDGQDVTYRADVFSAATVLYWLVCGVLPFSGPNPAALFRRILECRFDPVLQRRPTAGKPLARLIEQCLQKHPDDRPQRSKVVADALRAQLAEAGLTDAVKELAAYFDHPTAYEDALPARIVPAYLAAAHHALEGDQAARAMDFLDRVLALDEQHPDARALLARIERGGRRRRYVLGLGAGALATSAVVAAISFWPAPPSLPLDVPDVLPPTGGRPVPATTVPQTSPPSATPTLAPTAPPAPSAAPTAAARASEPPRPLRPRPSAPPTNAPVIAPVSAPPKPIAVPVKADLWSAEVFVNGALHGYAYEVRSAGGIPLAPGRYVLDFRHPACERQTSPVEIVAGQTVVPEILYHCKPLPARLRITSNRDAPVRRKADGVLLGQTNADILVPMTELRAALRLTIGDPGGSLQTAEVGLAAGKATTKAVDF
jgi:tRNA A-37 threonylcarbamoyl transferase component Bud32